jgi:hypothetical protein
MAVIYVAVHQRLPRCFNFANLRTHPTIGGAGAAILQA